MRARDRRRNEVYHWVIEFTNSDPELIKLFLEFLRRIIGIDEARLKAQLFVHSDLSSLSKKRKWSDITGISLRNFNKIIVLKSKSPGLRLSKYGTLKIRCHSKEAFQKLDSLIRNVIV